MTVPDGELVRRVDDRAADRRPSPAEKRFDTVGRAADVRAACQLAAAHARPAFLFTMNGRVNTGRC